MKKKKIAVILAALVLLTWAARYVFLDYIEPWQIGVRRSVTSGVSEEDFPVGYHLGLLGVVRFSRLPATTQWLVYANDDKGAAEPSLEVRTAENVFYVDVTIPWHIKSGEAWMIVKEGLEESYRSKVKSTVGGVLRGSLASLSMIDTYHTDQRIKAAEATLPRLNEALAQFHIEAERVMIRGIRYLDIQEKQLQNKQRYVVQGNLDVAKRKESEARQVTDTLEKSIDKEIALKREEWNRKVEDLRSGIELEIEQIEAEALQYDKGRRAEADASFAKAKAAGDLAAARAEALGERLKSQALASRAGRTYSGITAARNFKLGEVQLNSSDPDFLMRFGSMKAWHRFFIGD